MNWDEKAEDYAGAHHTYEHLRYGENMRFHKKFVAGAKWQRDQLRTDEAVERVALKLIEDEGETGWPSNEALGGGPTGDRDVEFRKAWLDYARTVITALLGEDS